MMKDAVEVELARRRVRIDELPQPGDVLRQCHHHLRRRQLVAIVAREM